MTKTPPPPSIKKGISRLIIAGLVVCLALGGGMFAYQEHMHKIALIKKEQETAALKAKQARKERKTEIQALFDSYLNDFQHEVFKKAKAYKKNRKLLKSLIRPTNYKSTEFAKENLAMFRESLAPSLRKQQGDIIGIFDKFSKKIEEELAGDDAALQKTFLAQWKNMSREQVDHYINFFAREEEMFQAYDDLILFYYTHSKRYTITELGHFDFTYDNDKKEAKAILKRVKELQNPVQKTHTKTRTSP